MMVAEKQKTSPPAPKNPIWNWVSVLVTAVLLIIGLWYLTQRVTLAELRASLAAARPIYILLSLLAMILGLVVKTWRWQILLTNNHDKPPFPPLFWAFNLGAYVNLILPFMRMGEVARLFAVDWMTHVGKARTLGTIVVEKTMDIIMLAITLALLLPYVVLPAFVGNPVPATTAVALLAILALATLAFRTTWVIQITRIFAGYLPAKWEDRVMGWLVNGLEGISALRSRRQVLIIIALSILTALLAILTPYFLLLAFNINLGFTEAALINILVTIAATPPSTPGKIGVVNGAAALALLGLGIQNDAAIFNYTTTYYLIVILPIIILGSLATSRTKWTWRRFT
jgi:uncharacterized protein (TIRG00374 family)